MRNIPSFLRFRQFLIHSLPLREQAYRITFQKWFSIFKKDWQRCQGPRRDNIYREGGERLDTRRMHGNIDAGGTRHFPQKHTFALIGLNQMHIRNAHYCQNHPGKPGATAKIDKRFRIVRQMWPELRRIQDMAPPDIVQRGRTNQIDPRCPSLKDIHVAL